MSKVIKTLKNKEHAIIESPTGTGKTLALLCSTLAWQQKSKELLEPFTLSKCMSDSNTTSTSFRNTHQNIPRIYYGIRTHEQIKQLVNELKQTSYRDSIRMTILASRERGCINDDIRHLEIRDELCFRMNTIKVDEKEKSGVRRVRLGKRCKYYEQEPNLLLEKFTPLYKYPHDGIWDIEDIVEFGKFKIACPYYGMRILQDKADIVFAPYNYLLDPTIRKSLNINLANAIVIIDEAHNIEDVCRDNASFDLTTSQLRIALDNLISVTGRCLEKKYRLAYMGYKFFETKLLALSELMNLNRLISDERYSLLRAEELILKGDELLDCLDRLGLGYDELYELKENLRSLKSEETDDFNTSKVQYDHLDRMDRDSRIMRRVRKDVGTIQRVDQKRICGFDNAGNIVAIASYNRSNENQTNNNNNESQQINHENIKIEDNQYTSLDRLLCQLISCLELLYHNHEDKTISNSSNFRLIIKRIDREHQGYGITHQLVAYSEPELKFHLLCQNPGVAFEALRDSAWSVIITSGTLTPLKGLEFELNCEFVNKLECSHIIDKKNFLATILSKGPTGLNLNCSFANSTNVLLQIELGKVMKDICITVPNGILCFFPSYERLELLYECWFNEGFINDIYRKTGKHIYREQQNMTKMNLDQLLKDYRLNSTNGHGAVLFAVYRGSMSEGINFSDESARAVVTIGIPYTNLMDSKIWLKRQYNDELYKTNVDKAKFVLSGQDWYNRHAFTALNQATGRCLRHKNDWGAIIMIDSRLNNSLNYISAWIRENLIQPKDYMQFVSSLKEFIVVRGKG